MTTVIGLDLSITSPAACCIPSGWELGVWSQLRFQSWKQPKPEHESDPDRRAREFERDTRCAAIATSVQRFVAEVRDRHGHVAVFVEDYSYGDHNKAVRLAELRGVVRDRLMLFNDNHVIPYPVPSASARKLLLGKLPGRKKGEPKPKPVKLVVQEVLYKHGATFANDDECDAFVIANFGMSELGLTALSLAGEQP